MKEFPKKILLPAFFNLTALFISVFFLFGGVLSPNNDVGDFLRIIIYIGAQMLWIMPIASSFIGLNQYRLGYPKRSFVILIAGSLMTLGCIVLLLI